MGLAMQGQTNKHILNTKMQQTLRSSMTDAERKLWGMLRGKQIGGLKFRRQHSFEQYILDFVCLEIMIVVEVDGGQHQESLAKDGIRTRVLEDAGFSVLRFWNHEVLKQPETVAEKIWQEVTRKKTHPHPVPLLEGEGVMGRGKENIA